MSLPEKLVEVASIPKAFSIAVTLALGGLALAVYEQRAAILLRIADSNLALTAVAVGAVMIAIVVVAWAFVSALDRRTLDHVKSLQEQIAMLQQQINDERDECDRKLKEARDYCDERIERLLRKV